jgi:hypothetical protein
LLKKGGRLIVDIEIVGVVGLGVGSWELISLLVSAGLLLVGAVERIQFLVSV